MAVYMLLAITMAAGDGTVANLPSEGAVFDKAVLDKLVAQIRALGPAATHIAAEALLLKPDAPPLAFEDVPRPTHVSNKSWHTYRPVNVAYNAHSRVHAVALLIDRDWHDQICEQASAAVLWFEFIGRACNHWHAVLRADVTEAVVLQAREAMRAMEDSWQNLDNMEGGRRNPSEQAFGSYSGSTVTIPKDGGVEFDHPSALLGFMWRTVLFAHATSSGADRDAAVKNTFNDASAFDHRDVSEACVEGAEDVASLTPGELRHSGVLDEHDIDVADPEDDERYRDREDIEYEDAQRELQYEADVEFWLDATSAWWETGLGWQRESVLYAAQRIDELHGYANYGYSDYHYQKPSWVRDYSKLWKERVFMDRRYDGHRSLRTRQFSLGGPDESKEQCPKQGVCGGHFDTYEDKLRGHLETAQVTAQRIEKYMTNGEYGEFFLYNC